MVFEFAHFAGLLSGLVFDCVLMAVELRILVHLDFVDFAVDLFLLAADFILKIFTDLFNASIYFLYALSQSSNVATLVLN